MVGDSTPVEDLLSSVRTAEELAAVYEVLRGEMRVVVRYRSGAACQDVPASDVDWREVSSLTVEASDTVRLVLDVGGRAAPS